MTSRRVRRARTRRAIRRRLHRCRDIVRGGRPDGLSRRQKANPGMLRKQSPRPAFRSDPDLFVPPPRVLRQLIVAETDAAEAREALDLPGVPEALPDVPLAFRRDSGV